MEVFMSRTLNFVSIVLIFMSTLVIPHAEETQVSDSVVGIYVKYPHSPSHHQATQAFGSGFVVSESGYIATNNHVIQHAESIMIQTKSGHRTYATPIGFAPEFDLSVLKITPPPNEKLIPIKYGSSKNLSVGESVTAIGNAFGFDQTLTQGVLSNLDRDITLGSQVRSFLQIDAAVNPGNSGGPLLNNDGQLIGVVSGIFGPSGKFNIGIAFAIPVDIARPVINQLINKGHASTGWIGISTQPLTPGLKTAFHAETTHGVLISDVVPNSPAAQANLKPKDILIEVNNTPIQSPHHLTSLVTAQGSSSVLNMSYLRDNHIKTTRFKTDSPKIVQNDQNDHWGIKLAEIEQASLNGDKSTKVIVSNISAQSNALLQGLAPGDTILSINHNNIHNLEDVTNSRVSDKNLNLIEVMRNNARFFVPL